MNTSGGKSRRKLIDRLVILMAAFALLAAACGSSSDGESADAGTDDATDVAADTSEDEPAADDTAEDEPADDAGEPADDAADEPADDAADASDDAADEPADDAADEAATVSTHVFQGVMSEEATDLNPLTTGQQGKGHVFQAIMIPLLEPDNNFTIFSRLLDSWETSADAKLVTLTLKPDIEWSDGTAITSADIYTTLTLYLDKNISNRAVRIGGVLGQDEFSEGTADEIVGLTVVDDLTLTVELANPDAAWLNNIGAQAEDLPLLPAHVLGDIPHDQILDDTYFREYPVSSGPYKLVEFVDGQYAEFERNENYSFGTPGFDQVFFRIVSTDVMSAQLETGEIDFMFPVDPADVERIGDLEGIVIESATGVAPDLWSLMHDEGSLDVRVRQAMLFAIDREGICQQAMAGYCSTPLTNIRQVAPAWSIPTVDEYPDLIEYNFDPDRARELLAEAEADGAWDPDTTLVFYHRPGRSYVDTAIAIAQSQMAEVGINWEIVNTDTGGLIDGIREQPIGTLDGFWVSGADFTIDPSAVQTYTSCETARTGANLISYCRPELDELWAAGRQTAVQDERQEIYHEAFRFLNADPAEIYLYNVDSIIAYDSSLQGIMPHGGVGQPYWNIADWTWEE